MAKAKHEFWIGEQLPDNRLFVYTDLGSFRSKDAAVARLSGMQNRPRKPVVFEEWPAIRLGVNYGTHQKIHHVHL